MQIINKIEVSYFRSVYRVELTGLGDINIVTGGNDSGKSNLLKALNLFFNNETELENQFDFRDDFCRMRNDQVRLSKGKGMIWIRVTFNNFLGWKSLPDKFSIRRQWNRYDTSYQQTVSDGISSTVISKFLNKIAFHYVPAIRGRDIFSHYLTLLHDSLIDDERVGLRRASESLISEINTSTAEMTRNILSGLGISSVIQPPSDLRDLFYSLDFSTQHGAHYIPLIKRGDGIQAHHIPFILNFLSEKSDRHHIWAYEEPENSLEMGRCFELADHFVNIFSNENQIILTTHSPAFYSINNLGVRRWLIEKSETTDGNWYSDAIQLNDKLDADASLGVAALIADRSRNIYEELAESKRLGVALAEKLKISQRNTILVEGPCDQLIFSKIHELLGGVDDVDFLPAGGTDPLSSFMDGIRKTKYSPRKFLGFVDGDAAGISAIKNCKADTNGCILDGFAYIFSLMYDEYHQKIMADVELKIFSWGIEHFLPTWVILEAIEQEKIIFSDIKRKNSGIEINFTTSLQEQFPDIPKYYFQNVDDSCKYRFAEWIVDKNSLDYFGNLVTIFQVGMACIES